MTAPGRERSRGLKSRLCSAAKTDSVDAVWCRRREKGGLRKAHLFL
jgi:hypothetical protein